MKTNLRRLLCLALCAIMVMALTPMGLVFADGDGDEGDDSSQTTGSDCAESEAEDRDEQEPAGTEITYYTVIFEIPHGYTYSGSRPSIEAQLVEDGGYASEPKIPDNPAGYFYFLGWFLENGTPFDFKTMPINGPTRLTAQFSSECRVYFEDAEGKIIYSTSIAPGSTITKPHLSITPPQSTDFTGKWLYKNKPDEYFYFNDTDAEATVIYNNIILIPELVNTCYVFFLSSGSPVDPALVRKGGTVSAPTPNPTRDGYEFQYWYSTDEDLPYNFGTKIDDKLILTAKWKAKPVNYQVVYWLEKEDVSGDPGTNPANYRYFSSEILTALAGSEVTAAATAGGASIYVTSEDTLTLSAAGNLRIAGFSHGTAAIVAGTGTTVVNAYFKRLSFTLVFNLNGVTGTTGAMMKDGQSYAASQYTFSAKYGQDIEAAWPSSANAAITGRTTAGDSVKFRGWVGERNPLTTKRFTLYYELLPTSGSSRTFNPIWGNTRTVQINYWLEVDKDTAGAVEKTFSGSTAYYLRSDLHSQILELNTDISNDGKAIQGYTQVGTVKTDKDGNVTATNPTIFNFYYTRRTYMLSFNTQVSGLTIPARSNVPFGKALGSLQPPDPVSAGNTFLGWYYEGSCITPVEWDIAKMPNGHLQLFAKWESNQFKASFFRDSTLKDLVHEAGVASGQTIADPKNFMLNGVYDVNGSIYDPNGTVALQGIFKGWYWFLPGSGGSVAAPFTFETVIMEDITLYAVWAVKGFHVTYDKNDGNGNAPVDEKSYEYGVGATALPAADLARDGYAFVGWKINKTGVTYYPGAPVPVNSDIALFAQWSPENQAITLTYNPNGASASSVVWVLMKEDTLHLAGPLFSRSDGYTLTGWNTFADGKGMHYDLGSLYTTGQNNVTLYAEWRRNEYTVSYINYDGGSLQAAVTVYTGDPITPYNGAAPSRTAAPGSFYTFTNWKLDPAGAEGPGKTVGLTNLVYRAEFKLEYYNYTLTYQWDGDTVPPEASLPSALNNKNVGDIIPIAHNPVITGWIFNGWYTQAGAPVAVGPRDASFTMPAGNVVLFGSWKQTNYTVTYAWAGPAPAGARLPETAENKHHLDSVVVAAKPTADGWTFNGWYTQPGALATVTPGMTSFTMPAGSVTLYGAWTQNGRTVTIVPPATLTLTFIVRGGPYGEAGKVVYSREATQGAVLSAPDYTAPDGYTFSGFRDMPEKMPSYSLTIYGNLTSAPNFEPEGLEIKVIEFFPDEPVPLAAPAKAAQTTPMWALVNLILTILTGAAMAVMLLVFLPAKQESTRSAKKKSERDRRGSLSLFTILPVAAAVIVFIFTEDMRLPMQLIDQWTIWMVLIAVLQMAAVLLISMLKKAAPAPPVRPTAAPAN